MPQRFCLRGLSTCCGLCVDKPLHIYQVSGRFYIELPFWTTWGVLRGNPICGSSTLELKRGDLIYAHTWEGYVTLKVLSDHPTWMGAQVLLAPVEDEPPEDLSYPRDDLTVWKGPRMR